MAKYNIYGHVLYSEIEYEKLMFYTERIFINALMNRLPSIETWTDDIWDNIDHEYMIKTLEEIKRDVIRQDGKNYINFNRTNIDVEKVIDEILDDTKKLKDLFEINKIDKFKRQERKFGEKIAQDYKKRVDTIDEWDEMQYLTEQVKNFKELEGVKIYKGGRHVPPSTYLSMLYNVNLIRTAWNQTFKDANYFDKDLMLLIPHALSCPHCASMQGKIYSISGKKGYTSIEVAYQHGVGHPNCKCEWSILWDKKQLQDMPDITTTPEEYEADQKKKGIEREIRRTKQDRSLYEMIGNQDEVDKSNRKLGRLYEKLNG